MPKHKLLIADDQAGIRQGLRQMLEEEMSIYIGGEARNGFEVLEKVRAEAWDLVILDLTMPGKNGFEVLKELRKECPELPVLVLSVHPAEQYAARSIELGARGYIVKERAPEELVPKVRELFQSPDRHP
ncbi:MAG: response regulator transcription factor [Candidatus Hydrogenedentes bacterium]|nr:response regulator transcription factor [Candidatus Hydrogenedentota bacterium]